MRNNKLTTFTYKLSLSSKVNPNPDLPAAFIPFFRRIFLMADAMKIHLKKNAAANGLELKERLQGLTATDVTHSRKSKAAILIFHIWPHKYCENPPSQITKHSLPINSQNKTGISAPSDLHSPVASLCFYLYSSYFFSFFFSAVYTFFPILRMTFDDT
ncbi:hypothetical protein DW828_18995 [Parabacteroides merdae]|uniref:Uncharacterized protein n=1 Tax=Parabacteroides merdae TaxID=46503 RepID=A0A3R6B357_9BACT|nr:hypothetical protein DW828_18995 [Parabacteroides merdae]